ncbi:MAG: hypothetical protein ACRD51_05885 [Candidatus Acidiferrum sp.]
MSRLARMAFLDRDESLKGSRIISGLPLSGSYPLESERQMNYFYG